MHPKESGVCAKVHCLRHRATDTSSGSDIDISACGCYDGLQLGSCRRGAAQAGRRVDVQYVHVSEWGGRCEVRCM
jgi:hypothetical protein